MTFHENIETAVVSGEQTLEHLLPRIEPILEKIVANNAVKIGAALLMHFEPGLSAAGAVALMVSLLSSINSVPAAALPTLVTPAPTTPPVPKTP